MDFSFLDWKVGDVPVILSFFLLVFARWIWFLGKVVLYALSVWLLSHRWAVRFCARLWIRANWDLGEALFSMLENTWSTKLGAITSQSGTAIVGLHAESNDREGRVSYDRNLEIQIDPEIKEKLSNRIERLDKLNVYREAFLKEVSELLKGPAP